MFSQLLADSIKLVEQVVRIAQRVLDDVLDRSGRIEWQLLMEETEIARSVRHAVTAIVSAGKPLSPTQP
jgi:hypothetical protein